MLQSVACLVGCGKTVAARAAVAALDQTRHTLIYLANPTTGTRGIHYQIVTALGGRPCHGTAALVAQAAGLLAAEHNERGRVPVLILDEGHLLQTDQLESVRMLTNGQMDAASPLACVLIGQPTLRRMIRLGVLAALDQRIGLRYAMPPMTPAETTSYSRVGLGRGSGIAPGPFPRPLAAPGVPVSGHRALHGLCRQAWLGAHGLGIVLPL